MKTERRHELQKNDLADYLGKYLQAAQPHLKWVGIALVAVVLVLLIGSFMSRRSASSLAEAWGEYFTAQTAEDPRKPLEDVATVYGDTSAGLWARQMESNMNLNQAASLIYSDRQEANTLLTEAREGFESVLERARDSFLLQHARFGLARTYELEGELNKARDYYKQVVSNGERTALGNKAQEQLDVLQNPDAREFYDWFAKQEISPPGQGAGLPEGLPDLPDFPNLNLPPAAPLGEPPATPTPPAETADPAADADAPVTEEAPADDPAVEEPVTEEPVTEEPVTEEPVTEEPAEPATTDPVPPADAETPPATSGESTTP